MRRLLWLVCASGCLQAETFTYWIQPCAPANARETACAAGDPELAEWALEAWHHTARQELSFASAPRDQARIRIFWASHRERLYGEARPVTVQGRRGTEIYVNPDVAQLGEEVQATASHDELLRDAIVYLTCVHESGHALGLTHTGKFEDIMYSFGFGGNVVEYFERYRRQIAARADIRTHSGISAYDRQRLFDLLRKHP